MRILRGTAFAGQDGTWEKIEVELDSDDLLAEEKSVEAHLQPLLLEVRADQQIVGFLEKVGHLTPEEAKEASDALRATRKSLLGLSRRPKTAPSRLLGGDKS